MLNRIEEILKEKKLTDKKFLTEANLPLSALSEWRKGKAKPSLDALIKIADYFNVSIDYLLGVTNHNTRKLKIGDVRPINFSMKEVFNQKNAFTRYAFHLLEAQSEVYAAHFLLDYIVPQNDTDENNLIWIQTFKMCITSLCEAAKIIILYDSNLENVFSKSRDVFFAEQNIVEKFNLFKSLWNNNKNFLLDIRNYISHFDHERKNYLSEYIDETEYHTFCICNNIVCDYTFPVFEQLLLKIYRKVFKNAEVSDDKIKKYCIKTMSDFFTVLLSLLSDMNNFFLDRYIEIKEVDGIQVAVAKENSLPFIEYSPTEKNTYTNTATISGEKNVIQQGNINNSPINFRTDDNLDEIEEELINILKNLSVKEKTELLTHAYQLEEKTQKYR